MNNILRKLVNESGGYIQLILKWNWRISNIPFTVKKKKKEREKIKKCCFIRKSSEEEKLKSLVDSDLLSIDQQPQS